MCSVRTTRTRASPDASRSRTSASIVGRAVVDDDELEILDVLGQDRRGRPPDLASAVVRRHDHAQRQQPTSAARGQAVTHRCVDLPGPPEGARLHRRHLEASLLELHVECDLFAPKPGDEIGDGGRSAPSAWGVAATDASAPAGSPPASGPSINHEPIDDKLVWIGQERLPLARQDPLAARGTSTGPGR